MKRWCFLCLICLIVINFLYGQNFSLDDKYPLQEDSLLSLITIDGQQIIIKYENPPIEKKDEVLLYSIKYYYNMPFIELSENMPAEVANWEDFKEIKNIKTSNKIMFLSFKGKHKYMFAFTEGYRQDKSPLTFTRYDEWGSTYKDCSSYLVEKNYTYSVDNLKKLVVDTPWVEGVEGDGIGEGFTIVGNNFNRPLGPYLFLINGYISYKKPYLYKQNNRIKKIKVTGLKSGKSKILEVLDTPHPQTVDISFITEPEDIRVEIEEVFKGTKYDDTCLHYCISFNEPVIPYENSIGE